MFISLHTNVCAQPGAAIYINRHRGDPGEYSVIRAVLLPGEINWRDFLCWFSIHDSRVILIGELPYLRTADAEADCLF